MRKVRKRRRKKDHCAVVDRQGHRIFSGTRTEVRDWLRNTSKDTDAAIEMGAPYNRIVSIADFLGMYS